MAILTATSESDDIPWCVYAQQRLRVRVTPSRLGKDNKTSASELKDATPVECRLSMTLVQRLQRV
ncbi:MAG: hypothetical protein WBO73_07785 [Gammaproteobacteria bacterium]|jgi:hypothetical protein